MIFVRRHLHICLDLHTHLPVYLLVLEHLFLFLCISECVSVFLFLCISECVSVHFNQAETKVRNFCDRESVTLVPLLMQALRVTLSHLIQALTRYFVLITLLILF